MSSNNSHPPGYVPITSKSLPAGAGTPQDAAIANMKANAATAQQIKDLAGGKTRRRARIHSPTRRHRHRSISRTHAGGKRRRRPKRGGGVAAPQFQPRYNETAGNGTGTNDQIATLTQNNMQSAENSRMDTAATSLKGGRSRRRTRRRQSFSRNHRKRANV